MSNTRQYGAIMMGLVGSVAILTGCGTTITSDTSLSDALATLAGTVTTDSVLSQLTVGDVVQGFEEYASQFATDDGTGTQTAGNGLTADEQAQLNELQSQLDSGVITEEEFAQQVQELVGDVAPRHAFAGMDRMGGPFRGHPAMSIADQLELTDEQRQQADEIFQTLHDDIAALRDTAEEQIQALLTADQLARLEELRSQPRPHGDAHGRRMGPPPAMDQDPNAAPDNGLDPATCLADELQLTEEQQTAIEQIHTDLRATVKVRHQQARDEFRAILTTDQLAILDEIEAQHEQQ